MTTLRSDSPTTPSAGTRVARADRLHAAPPNGFPIGSHDGPPAVIPRGAGPAERVRKGEPSRKEGILSGASEVFAERGYYGSSLRGIAKHIGISHPGLLHHFPTKVSLLHGSIDRLEEHAQLTLDHVDEIGASPASLLHAFDTRWNPSLHTMQLLASLDAGSTSGSHPGRLRIARLRRVHEHVLEECLTALAARGLLRDDIHPASAARALLAVILSHAIRESTVRTMQQSQHDDSPLSDLRKLTETYLRAAPVST